MRVVSVLRTATALALTLLSTAAFGQSTDTPKLLPGESVVRIEAEGSVERMPDSLGIGVTIVSEGRTPGEAAERNLAKLTELVGDLASLGIDKAFISAENLSAQPVYAEDNGRQDRSRIVGYRARQTVGVELLDLSRVQRVITLLAEEGYGELQATFRLKEPRVAEAAAQRAAIASARAEAENVAAALGKRVGRLLLVGNKLEAYRGWTGLGQDIIVSGSRIPPIELKPAPVEVESRVYVDWSLVDR